MTRDIRVIGFDLDDTALDSRKRLRPAVRQALEDAAAAGITVLPATGRLLSGIPPEVLAVKGVRYALTANGAKVYDLSTGAVMVNDCFDTDTALSVLAVTDQFRCFPGVYIGGEGYTNTDDYSIIEGFVTPEIADYLRKTRRKVDDLAAFICKSDEPVEKFANHFADQGELERAWKLLEARGDVSITSSMPHNMEVNTRSCNKGSSLLRLAEQLGYRREQVMAAGDSLNDLEMMRHVGYAVAMGNAIPEVKALADEVTGSMEEDGLAQAIRRVLGA